MKIRRLELLGLVVALVAIVAVLAAAPARAQSTGAPLFSVQRVSIGIGGDFTSYRPTLLDLTRQEFRAVLPMTYNLGPYVSLTGRIARGLSSAQTEYSVGFVLHLLARGKRP